MRISKLIGELADNLEAVGDGEVLILVNGKKREIYSVCYPSTIKEGKSFSALIELKESEKCQVK